MKKVEEDLKLINQSYKEDLEKRLAYMQKKDSVKKFMNKVPVRIFQKDAVNPSITQPVPEKPNLEAEPEKDFFFTYGTGIQAVMWVVYFLFMTIYILNASPIFISTILAVAFLITYKLSTLEKIKFFLVTLCFFITYIYLETYLKGTYVLQENVGASFINKYNNIFDFFKTFSFISFNLIIGILKRPILLLSLISLIYLTIFRIKDLKYFNFLLVTLFLNIGFVYAIYFTTSFPLEGYIAPTLGRLLLETSGFYIVSIVIFFDLINKRRNVKN
jgi:hypothetical protein